MATRIYTATDGADDVRLNHLATLPDLEKALKFAAAGWLVYHGLRSAGLVSAVFTLGGAALAAKTFTGKPLGELLNLGGRSNHDTPSYRDEGRASTQAPEDVIEEASMESFPASDPPASHRSTQLPPEH